MKKTRDDKKPTRAQERYDIMGLVSEAKWAKEKEKLLARRGEWRTVHMCNDVKFTRDEDLRDFLCVLGELPHLTTMTLYAGALWPRERFEMFCECVGRLPWLREFNCNAMSFSSDKTTMVVKALKNVKTLRKLNVSDNHLAVSSESMSALKTILINGLRKLVIRNCLTGRSDLKRWIINNAYRLKLVKLDGISLTDSRLIAGGHNDDRPLDNTQVLRRCNLRGSSFSDTDRDDARAQGETAVTNVWNPLMSHTFWLYEIFDAMLERKRREPSFTPIMRVWNTSDETANGEFCYAELRDRYGDRCIVRYLWPLELDNLNRFCPSLPAVPSPLITVGRALPPPHHPLPPIAPHAHAQDTDTAGQPSKAKSGPAVDGRQGGTDGGRGGGDTNHIATVPSKSEPSVSQPPDAPPVAGSAASAVSPAAAAAAAPCATSHPPSLASVFGQGDHEMADAGGSQRPASVAEDMGSESGGGGVSPTASDKHTQHTITHSNPAGGSAAAGGGGGGGGAAESCDGFAVPSLPRMREVGRKGMRRQHRDGLPNQPLPKEPVRASSRLQQHQQSAGSSGTDSARGKRVDHPWRMGKDSPPDRESEVDFRLDGGHAVDVRLCEPALHMSPFGDLSLGPDFQPTSSSGSPSCQPPAPEHWCVLERSVGEGEWVEVVHINQPSGGSTSRSIIMETNQWKASQEQAAAQAQQGGGGGAGASSGSVTSLGRKAATGGASVPAATTKDAGDQARSFLGVVVGVDTSSRGRPLYRIANPWTGTITDKVTRDRIRRAQVFLPPSSWSFGIITSSSDLDATPTHNGLQNHQQHGSANPGVSASQPTKVFKQEEGAAAAAAAAAAAPADTGEDVCRTADGGSEVADKQNGVAAPLSGPHDGDQAMLPNGCEGGPDAGWGGTGPHPGPLDSPSVAPPAAAPTLPVEVLSPSRQLRRLTPGVSIACSSPPYGGRVGWFKPASSEAVEALRKKEDLTGVWGGDWYRRAKMMNHPRELFKGWGWNFIPSRGQGARNSLCETVEIKLAFHAALRTLVDSMPAVDRGAPRRERPPTQQPAHSQGLPVPQKKRKKGPVSSDACGRDERGERHDREGRHRPMGSDAIRDAKKKRRHEGGGGPGGDPLIPDGPSGGKFHYKKRKVSPLDHPGDSSPMQTDGDDLMSRLSAYDLSKLHQAPLPNPCRIAQRTGYSTDELMTWAENRRSHRHDRELSEWDYEIIRATCSVLAESGIDLLVASSSRQYFQLQDLRNSSPSASEPRRSTRRGPWMMPRLRAFLSGRLNQPPSPLLSPAALMTPPATPPDGSHDHAGGDEDEIKPFASDREHLLKHCELEGWDEGDACRPHPMAVDTLHLHPKGVFGRGKGTAGDVCGETDEDDDDVTPLSDRFVKKRMLSAEQVDRVVRRDVPAARAAGGPLAAPEAIVDRRKMLLAMSTLQWVNDGEGPDRDGTAAAAAEAAKDSVKGVTSDGIQSPGRSVQRETTEGSHRQHEARPASAADKDKPGIGEAGAPLAPVTLFGMDVTMPAAHGMSFVPSQPASCRDDRPRQLRTVSESVP
ncbi:unnamed protein product [Vitrella brassicaformis CCMP3155]|uniref:Uncharacterized protein n=2 Tax=Vitrella brassicaformis TaxID=1169539 RepID=A0A0G4F205_VITBC|nr:unnamed protein product [Vitrella brassicaformis CCMP3155]|eukprot:CEM05906.1 unnamed protein product [Vitrella brassicaformis CCMP3155]